MLFSVSSEAGEQVSSEYCYQSGGAGYCYGTFLAFRNSSNADDYAAFLTTNYGSNTYGFNAEYSDSSYYCSLPSSMNAAGPLAMANRGYFEVTWNSSGVCTGVVIDNGSEYGNF